MLSREALWTARFSRALATRSLSDQTGAKLRGYALGAEPPRHNRLDLRAGAPFACGMKGVRFGSVCLAAVFLATLAPPIYGKIWTDNQGHKLDAELLRVEGDSAIFKTADRELKVPLANLSPEDRASIEQPQPAPPASEAAPPAPAAGPLTLPGGVALVPGKVTEFVLEATEEDRKNADLKDLETIRVKIDVPEGFNPAGDYRLFLPSDTQGGKNANKVSTYGRQGIEHGFVVLGAESGTPEREKHSYHQTLDACLNRVLKEIFAIWPKAKTWPFYYGGFSGGAKNCFYLAAHVIKEREIEPRGFYMGGCNEATLMNAVAEERISKSKFKDAAYFITNGTSDDVATVDQGSQVAAAIRGAGCRNVRVETYEGGHRFNAAQFGEALAWFITQEKK